MYEDINRADSASFAAWYGIGECNANDDIVLADQGRLRFRSSYRRALDGYEHAFALLPSINRSFSASAFSRLQALLKTSPNDLRAGRALAPDTVRFASYAEWDGDTLGFTPHPLSQIEASLPSTIPVSLPKAVDAERQLFRRITGTWAAALPGDPSALEAVAVSLDLLGDRSAIDTLRRARRLSTDSSQTLRLAAQEVWVRLKFALPDSIQELAAARALADSLARKAMPRTQADASVLLNLSAVTGDVAAAIALVGTARPSSFADSSYRRAFFATRALSKSTPHSAVRPTVCAGSPLVSRASFRTCAATFVLTSADGCSRAPRCSPSRTISSRRSTPRIARATSCSGAVLVRSW